MALTTLTPQARLTGPVASGIAQPAAACRPARLVAGLRRGARLRTAASNKTSATAPSSNGATPPKTPEKESWGKDVQASTPSSKGAESSGGTPAAGRPRVLPSPEPAPTPDRRAGIGDCPWIPYYTGRHDRENHRLRQLLCALGEVAVHSTHGALNAAVRSLTQTAAASAADYPSLRRTPLSGGVKNATARFELPTPEVAVRNLVSARPHSLPARLPCRKRRR